jgi:hypothetical protein
MSEVLELLSSELDERKIREIAAHLGTDHSQTEAAIAAALPTLVSAMSRTAETEQGAQMISSQMQGIGGGSLSDLLGGLLGSSKRPSPPASRESAAPRNQGSSAFDDILPPGFKDTLGAAVGKPAAKQQQPPPPASRSSQSSALDRSLGPGNELPSSLRQQRTQDDSDDASGVSSSSLDDVLGNVLGGKQKRVEDSIGKSSGMDIRKIGPLLAILAPLVLGAMKARASSPGASSASGIDPSSLTKMMRGERKSIEQQPGGSLIGRMLDQDGDGDFDLSDIVKLGMKFFFSRK